MRRLRSERTLLIPLQPGFGRTERIDWIRSYRDLAGLYSQVIREMERSADRRDRFLGGRIYRGGDGGGRPADFFDGWCWLRRWE